MKKGIVIALLAALVLGGLPAQEEAPAPPAAPPRTARHTISGGFLLESFVFVTYTGIDVEYEFEILDDFLGVAAEAGTGSIFLLILPFTTFEFMGKARIYPFRKTFYIDAGMTYMTVPDLGLSALGVVGSLGWKVDIGEPGGFVIMPSVGLNFVFDVAYDKGNDDARDFFEDGGPEVMPFVTIGLRFGYSF